MTDRTAVSHQGQEPDFWRCTKCGCLWRDNHDNTVSLGSAKQTSCPECELRPTSSACEPLFRLALASASSYPSNREAELQELINDLYRLFTMTTQEIAAEFGEARCKDDSARINYALELLADHVTDCATATDEPFFKPNADFKQVKDWVKAVPLSTPHQEEEET